MAKLIGIYGEPATGKSTSLRNLPPEETLYIEADMKGLNWKGWKKEYNGDNKNYLKTNYPQVAIKYLQLAEKGTYKYVVIDTVNNLMVSDEMRRCKEKGYDKWMDLAVAVYGIIDYALTMRDDITVIFVCHSQTVRDDSGYMFTSIKTNGQKLSKIGLETKFPIVLYAKCIDGQYLFETQANFSTAKTPMGMFEEKTIPNDIAEVLKAVEAYENG